MKPQMIKKIKVATYIAHGDTKISDFALCYIGDINNHPAYQLVTTYDMEGGWDLSYNQKTMRFSAIEWNPPLIIFHSGNKDEWNIRVGENSSPRYTTISEGNHIHPYNIRNEAYQFGSELDQQLEEAFQIMKDIY